MRTRSEDRVVIVTGANEGIGYHLAATLLDDGFRVAAFDIAGDRIEALGGAFGDRFRYVECDVTVDEDVERAVATVIEEWGRIDRLVNNAGVFHLARFEDRTLADTRREFEVNYFGYLRLLHAVLPHMRERGSGIVHNLSSGVGITGTPALSGYASTKGAIEALVRSLRFELHDEDVHVTLMHPPLTNTRSGAAIGYPVSMMQDPADVGRKLARRIDSTDAVIYADWSTRLGLGLVRRVPSLVRRGSNRFADPAEAADAAPPDSERVRRAP